MSRREKPSKRVRIKLDMTFDLMTPVDSTPIGGPEAFNALRFAVAREVWKLLPKEQRNKYGTISMGPTAIGFSVDRRKP